MSTITLTEQINLPLGNRDGSLIIGKDASGKCFLILEADTFHIEPTFTGLGSTEHMEITTSAFGELSAKGLAV